MQNKDSRSSCACLTTIKSDLVDLTNLRLKKRRSRGSILWLSFIVSHPRSVEIKFYPTMVALKFSESRDQKSFAKFQLDQEKCAPHTKRCADTELAGLDQEKCSTSPKAGTTSIRSLICDVLLIVCFGLVILLLISVAIWIYINQECIFRNRCNCKMQTWQSLDLRYWGTSMKEAENASIFFGFENVFAVGNLKSFHIVKVSILWWL